MNGPAATSDPGAGRLTGSLRFRLLAGAAVWIALALAMAGVVLSGLFHDHVARRFEAELTNHLDQLAALIEVGADGAPLLRQPLAREHIKPRLLGHWGTTPGLNFIYVHLNRLITERD